MPKKTPAVTAAKKEESRHDQWWYPQRCEAPGCSETSKDALKKCAGCNMVMYCCKEHQKADWKAHKEECKLFTRLNLRSTFYTDDDMLTRFPLRPCGQRARNSGRQAVADGSCCALCGKNDQQEDMTRTDCCSQVVCDNSKDYKIGTYSREFCQRSHDRYTLCGYHGVERWCDTTKDWRECPGCTKRHTQPDDIADMLWRGLNSYNFCPLLSKDVPRHARCETCSTCKKKFMMGVQGGSMNADGRACLSCAAAAFGPAFAGAGGPMMLMQGQAPLPTFKFDHATDGGL